MKKIIALLLALTMVFAFAACAAKTETPATTETTTTETTTTEETKTEETPAAETTDEVKTYKVGVAIYQFDDNFMTLYRNELKSYMESLQTDTVKYDITIVDGKNDMATQTEQINSFITQGVDLIICNLVQTSSADTIVNKVVDAGIPLVLINREPLAYDADGKPWTRLTKASSTTPVSATSVLTLVSPVRIRAKSSQLCLTRAMQTATALSPTL